MSIFSAFSFFWFWGQTGLVAGKNPPRVSFAALKAWLYVLGEPSRTLPDDWGPLLNWLKIVGLLAFLAWAGAWAVTAVKERTIPYELNIAALIGLIGSVFGVLLLLSQTQNVDPMLTRIAQSRFASILDWIFRLLLLLWVEWALWSSILGAGRRPDRAALIGIHLALGFGLASGFFVHDYLIAIYKPLRIPPPHPPFVSGVRMAGTFMGLVVLARVAGLFFRELVKIRWRRLYSIASQTIVESYRRTWAPWVLIAVFVVVLAFTDWFLRPPREAELGRIFVSSLVFLISLLLLVMVMILTPISLPKDIQEQTIYTVVSKPVRRLELVWGRMIGFMTLVTLLLAFFGGLSLIYLERQVQTAINSLEQQARIAAQSNPRRARVLQEQADQLKKRKSARVAVKGLLDFRDSRGNLKRKGINVGSEMEARSHIEGATESAAYWHFGVRPDPYYPNILLDKRIDVNALLRAGTIEAIENQAALLRLQAARVQAEGGSKNSGDYSRKLQSLLDQAKPIQAEADALRRREADLLARAKTAATAEEARSLRAEAAKLHSSPIPVEMTFNVFRTTKGTIIGEAVYATMKVSNPHSTLTPHLTTFPVREYYTDTQFFPASYLVGCDGDLEIEIKCLSPTQYIGMAESDLYILSAQGSFWRNYLRGMFGIWLQAMVLTAIGVFAGTFLSWPVALLTTIFFFLSGVLAYGFLQDFALQETPVGGGPFESMIRLVTQANLVAELPSTPAVLTAKTLDALVLPVMSRLFYVIPNFSAMDVSNTVALGFAVDSALLRSNLLIALAYVFPFSIAAYFILKNREVAA